MPLIGDVLLVYFSDCIDADHKWWTSQGIVKGQTELFPYDKTHWNELRDFLCSQNKKLSCKI